MQSLEEFGPSLKSKCWHSCSMKGIEQHSNCCDEEPWPQTSPKLSRSLSPNPMMANKRPKRSIILRYIEDNFHVMATKFEPTKVHIAPFIWTMWLLFVAYVLWELRKRPNSCNRDMGGFHWGAQEPFPFGQCYIPSSRCPMKKKKKNLRLYQGLS